jgi:predicted esterase
VTAVQRLQDALAIGLFRIGALFLLITLRTRKRSPQVELPPHAVGPHAIWHRPVRLPPHAPDELELLALVTDVLPRLDPWMSRSHARIFRVEMHKRLAQLAVQRDYRSLGSVALLPAYGRIDQPDHGHSYFYWPVEASERPVPLLVMLHGHGGNSLLLLHFWEAWAKQHQIAVLLPSFGYGNWEHPDAAECVTRSLAAVAERYPVAVDAFWLAGLSQGGAGLAPIASTMPQRIRGLVYFSGTMLPAALRQLPPMPVLVVQGGKDHNVTPQSVRRGVAILLERGCDVTEIWDEQADHFLLFAQSESLLGYLKSWMDAKTLKVQANSGEGEQPRKLVHPDAGAAGEVAGHAGQSHARGTRS